MAFTAVHEQSKAIYAASGSPDAAVKAGSSIFVWASCVQGSNPDTHPAVADSINGAYTPLGSPVINGVSVGGQWFVFRNAAAGTPTVTVTPYGNNSDLGFSIHEYSGLPAGFAVAVATYASASAENSGYSGTITPPAGYTLLIAAMAEEDQGTSTTSLPNSFTFRTSADNHHHSTGDRIVTADGSTSYSTYDSSGSAALWIGQILAIYEEVSSATLTQSGFRFRHDDGSETGATWDAAENTNISAAAGTKRVRAALKASGNPAAITPRWEWQSVSEGVWRPLV
jgi:hypothetical protein